MQHGVTHLATDAGGIHQRQCAIDGLADEQLASSRRQERAIAGFGVDADRARQLLGSLGAIRLELGGDDDLGMRRLRQLLPQALDAVTALRRHDVEHRARDAVGHEASAEVIGDGPGLVIGQAIGLVEDEAQPIGMQHQRAPVRREPARRRTSPDPRSR